MKKRKLIIISIIILIILVILLLIILFINTRQKSKIDRGNNISDNVNISPSPIQFPSLSTEEIKNYENVEYNFSLTYPKTWLLKEENTCKPFPTSEGDQFCITLSKNDFILEIDMLRNSINFPLTDVLITDNYPNTSKFYIDHIPVYRDTYTENVNGVNFINIVEIKKLNNPPIQDNYGANYGDGTFPVKYKNINYAISYNLPYFSSNISNITEIAEMDYILSLIKFIEK
jgi:hypothetical protein